MTTSNDDSSLSNVTSYGDHNGANGASNGRDDNGLNGLSRINTKGRRTSDICSDDSGPSVTAQNVDELHSLQVKKSAPSTPRGVTPKGGQMTPKGVVTPRSEEETQRQQMESISSSLASLTRERGPQVLRGDPAKRKEVVRSTAPPRPNITDSALKFTHVLHNLSPGELYEQALKHEKGSHITSGGALATLSGAKTGRSPKDKRVVIEDTSKNDLWWGKGSPNIEMDEDTFLMNRERAVDYLNSLDKVFVNDQFLNWDSQNRLKVAGTVDGVKEPTSTFSACFGAAFIMMHPTKYAAMLAEKMKKHNTAAWLVNTGWSGGSYGVGSRMKLAHTRRIIDAIHDGSLLEATYEATPIFNLQVPSQVKGVPKELLHPENSWKDKKLYGETLKKLAGMFQKNFVNFQDYKVGDQKLTEAIVAAGPIVD